jgi:hypothetical protein
LLISSQNSDGGWGYHPGSESGVEATSWVLLVLGLTDQGNSMLGQAGARGFDWLRRAQLPDGSWPAFVGQSQGCWASSLACLALLRQTDSTDLAAKGINWLINTWPAEGGWWWRLRHRLFFWNSSVVRQDSALRGWSWTPGTASWVEPTSYALILLRSATEDRLPSPAAKRKRLAQDMLYDRMCPGGGWNSGNPLVYDVAGEPRVGPTVWALLALREFPERLENKKSLQWLEKIYPEIQGPGSLALAHLCLSSYDRPPAPLEAMLEALYLENQFLNSVLVSAWAILALSGAPLWLAGVPAGVKQ